MSLLLNEQKFPIQADELSFEMVLFLIMYMVKLEYHLNSNPFRFAYIGLPKSAKAGIKESYSAFTFTILTWIIGGLVPTWFKNLEKNNARELSWIPSNLI